MLDPKYSRLKLDGADASPTQPEFQIPSAGWLPRRHQQKLWFALEDGILKRFLVIYPRRHGKDELALTWAAVQMQRRVGQYFHMLPAATQARKAIWEAVNEETGRRRIFEAFPREAIADNGIRENEMAIRFRNGSQWQVVGSDNYETLIGSSPVGLVYSEWSLSRPESWLYLSPIIERNGGTALFITTPRGTHNHATEMYHKYKDNPKWYTEKLSSQETDVFTLDRLEEIKSDLVTVWGEDQGTALFEQEYLCSLTSSVLDGNYYGREMQKMYSDDRVADVPYDPNLRCFTSWDIGMSNTMVCLIWQIKGAAFHLIDMIHHTDVGFDYFANELNKRGLPFSEHLFPHDIGVHEVGAAGGMARLESVHNLGIRPARLVPRISNISDGINAVRGILPKCYIDRKKCGKVVEALQKYHRKWSSDRKCFSETPQHDWTSDYVDAVRTFAQANPDATLTLERRPILPKRRGMI